MVLGSIAAGTRSNPELGCYWARNSAAHCAHGPAALRSSQAAPASHEEAQPDGPREPPEDPQDPRRGWGGRRWGGPPLQDQPGLRQ